MTKCLVKFIKDYGKHKAGDVVVINYSKYFELKNYVILLKLYTDLGIIKK
jgi:hypothetical protein